MYVRSDGVARVPAKFQFLVQTEILVKVLTELCCLSVLRRRSRGPSILDRQGLFAYTQNKLPVSSRQAWRIRLEAKDTALSRRRSRVRIPYALLRTEKKILPTRELLPDSGFVPLRSPFLIGNPGRGVLALLAQQSIGMTSLSFGRAHGSAGPKLGQGFPHTVP